MLEANWVLLIGSDLSAVGSGASEPVPPDRSNHLTV